MKTGRRTNHTVLCALTLVAAGAAWARESRIPAAAAAVAVRTPHGATVHVVADPQSALEKRMTGELCAYLGRVVKQPPAVVPELARVPGSAPAIILSSRALESPVALVAPEGREGFALATAMVGKRPVVLAVGNTDSGLERAIQRLIVRSRQERDALVIPALALAETPWIPQREYTVCPWVPEIPSRGGPIENPNADSRLNIYKNTDRQLADSAAMFDWFGFSGPQLYECAVSYAAAGSVEAAHDWTRKFARAAMSLGQDVSLGVWAAGNHDIR